MGRSRGEPVTDLAERRTTTKADINRTMQQLMDEAEPAR